MTPDRQPNHIARAEPTIRIGHGRQNDAPSISTMTVSLSGPACAADGNCLTVYRTGGTDGYACRNGRARTVTAAPATLPLLTPEPEIPYRPGTVIARHREVSVDEGSITAGNRRNDLDIVKADPYLFARDESRARDAEWGPGEHLSGTGRY